MFMLNYITVNFPFSETLWWRSEYFQFQAEYNLKYLPLFKKSIEEYKSLDGAKKILDYYSDYYKNRYILDIIQGENNVNANANELEHFLKNGSLDSLSTKDQLKIANLKNTVNKLFPNIFFSDMSHEGFNVELSVNLNRVIGKDLFKYPGKFRENPAMASQENYFYLEPDRIETEMNKLFNNVREKFLDFKEKNDIENMIKLSSQFLINFLTIHPFENGNGRVARLLLSYLISSITVVPLSLYSKVNGRKVYLECLKDERTKSPTDASNLASLILECAHFDLEKACKFLDIFPTQQ